MADLSEKGGCETLSKRSVQLPLGATPTPGRLGLTESPDVHMDDVRVEPLAVALHRVVFSNERLMGATAPQFCEAFIGLPLSGNETKYFRVSGSVVHLERTNGP